jgi:hypothetical protein
MNKPLVLAAAVLGVVFLVLACVYWFVPAGSLPHFIRRWLEPRTRQTRVSLPSFWRWCYSDLSGSSVKGDLSGANQAGL